jgi:hypothetical protein
MTAAEHACCKQMKGRCGSMRMPASHSCCQPGFESNRSDLVPPQSASFHVHVAVLAIYAQLSMPGLPFCGYRPIEKLDHSPPPHESLPSVLKI